MRGHFKDQCFRIIGYPDWFMKKSNVFSPALGSRFAGNVSDSTDILGSSPLDNEDNMSSLQNSATQGSFDPQLMSTF